MGLVPSHTLHLHPLHRATPQHPCLNLLLHLVAVVFSEDFEDSEVAQAVEVQLAAVLVAEGATPGVASVYPQALEHWDMDKVHFRTPAALRMEANRTPGLVLPGFQANTQGDLEGFELGLTPVVALASPAQEALGQVELAADGTGVEDMVERLAFGVVEHAVAVAALG